MISFLPVEKGTDLFSVLRALSSLMKQDIR